MDLGITVQSFYGDLLNEPWEVYDEDGLAFTNFKLYWAKCMSLPLQPSLLPPPMKLVPSTGTEIVESCSVEDLCLENNLERSSNTSLKGRWSPGWTNANKILIVFINNHLSDYSKNRTKVEGTTTSLLSPYLHFGEISVRKIYHCTRMKQIQWAKEGKLEAKESVHLLLRAIGLREYSRHLCFNFPASHQRSLLGNLNCKPWRANESRFKCWRQGRTGYPLVDAGMRELWATGWVHNQIRVITSSFLIKFLLLPWTHGMEYFWGALVDADMEFDVLVWQYISGGLLGVDKLSYLDSPPVQGCKYDPGGSYVRTWIPELARMPTEWIHNPFDAPKSVLEAAGVELGSNYPNPIIDIKVAKKRLDNAVSTMWELHKGSLGAKYNRSTEDLAESLKVPDIMKAAAKKQVSSICTSTLDQRVPSFQQHPSILCEGSKKVDTGKQRNVETKGMMIDDVETLIDMDEEDETSTVISSSSFRKRRLSDGQCSFSSIYFSSSSYRKTTTYEFESFKPHNSMGSSVVHPWRELDDRGVEKDEEVEAESRLEGLRPCKRPS